MEEKRKRAEAGKFATDEFTPFRYVLKCINGPARKRNIDITLKDLKDQWLKQEGICPYSKVKLVLKTHKKSDKIKQYLQASIDRKDSSKPYTKDNIQFVSVTCNLAKQSSSDEEMREFIDIIVKNYSNSH